MSSLESPRIDRSIVNVNGDIMITESSNQFHQFDEIQ